MSKWSAATLFFNQMACEPVFFHGFTLLSQLTFIAGSPYPRFACLLQIPCTPPYEDFGRLHHNSARERHTSQTGNWLLHSDQHQKWKLSKGSHLCMYGKAGCGETVLCSTAVIDIQGIVNTVQTLHTRSSSPPFRMSISNPMETYFARWSHN